MTTPLEGSWPDDDVAEAIRKSAQDLTHTVDMAWRMGMRDGLEMAAKIVEAGANSNPHTVLAGMLLGLRDSIRLAQYQIPDHAERPTPKVDL